MTTYRIDLNVRIVANEVTMQEFPTGTVVGNECGTFAQREANGLWTIAYPDERWADVGGYRVLRDQTFNQLPRSAPLFMATEVE